MKTIKNPNDIVGQYVADYQKACSDNLVSIVLYGSATTHEFSPGKSDINTVVVLKDNSIAALAACHATTLHWRKRGIATPFFMTHSYIEESLDSYPVEFLWIKRSYRVLFGPDLFATISLDKEDLRLQCERELKGLSLHIRRAFLENSSQPKRLIVPLNLSLQKLFPVFCSIILLYDRPVPKDKSEIIGSIETLFGLGASVFSTAFNIYLKNERLPVNVIDFFETYSHSIDRLIKEIDHLTIEKGV